MTWAIPRLASIVVVGLVAWLAPRPHARPCTAENQYPTLGTPAASGAPVEATTHPMDHLPFGPMSLGPLPIDSVSLDRMPIGPVATGMEIEANLLAMVSHDLRTPLTSVKGFAQLLLRDKTASEASRRYAAVILAETNRTIRTIDDVADLARLYEGHDDLEIRSVNLAPIVVRAVEGARHQDLEGRLQLAVPDELPEVPADAARIERIVTNLVANSLRYSPGPDPIEVGAATCDGGVEIWVRDRGAGIPIEKYAHVFDLGPSSSDGHEVGESGSGLGLYISKRLVEAQGGTIWVEQEAGRGTGFRFRLAASLRASTRPTRVAGDRRARVADGDVADR